MLLMCPVLHCLYSVGNKITTTTTTTTTSTTTKTLDYFRYVNDIFQHDEIPEM